jgi:hypothetical protein
MQLEHSGYRCPYPGIDPFSFEQRDLFFGRDVEGRIVSSMIAAEPISILTGASGTGKSSLIRAMVMPTLIRRGWGVVYVQPHADPLAALSRELVAQIIPNPSEEVGFIRQLLRRTSKLTPESPLSKAVEWYSSLPHGDPRRLDISTSSAGEIPRIPMLSMVLAGVLPFEQAASCLAELAGANSLAEDRGDPSLARLCAMEGDLIRGRERVVAAVSFGEPPSFAELAGRLWRDWLLPNSARGLVVILDQAEELYTLLEFSEGYLAAGETDAARARYATLREILFRSIDEFVAASKSMPLHLCVSLRPEWYTDLRISLGTSMPDEARALHVLRPMSRKQAEGAIVEPAKYVGSAFEDGAKRAILDALEHANYGQGIDPFLLGLICHLAWDFAPQQQNIVVSQTQIDKIAAGPEGETLIQDTDSASRTPRLVKGALLWLFRRVFGKMDEPGKFDALDLLENLFTSRGTRRIVSEEEIINRPLRSRKSLLAILGTLDDAHLVRRVWRGRGKFVEIRHDRLIEPLLAYKKMLTNLEQHGQLTAARYRSFLNPALDALVRFEGKRLSQAMADGIDEDVLPAWAREALRCNADAVAWDSAAARVMLTSLLFAGPDRPTSADTSQTFRENIRELIVKSSQSMYDGDNQGSLSAARDLLPRGPHIAETDLRPLLLRELNSWPIDARMMFLDGLVRQGSTMESICSERGKVRKWIRACLGLSVPV